MGAHPDLLKPLAGDGQAFVNPLIAGLTPGADDEGTASDVEAAAAASSLSSSSSAHAPSARLAALVVLAHAVTFWGLFLQGRKSSTAAAAAALTYEAIAILTSLLLAGLWVWSRLARTAKTSSPPLPRATLSIPALAALFALQWAAFSYLLLSGCCA